MQLLATRTPNPQDDQTKALQRYLDQRQQASCERDESIQLVHHLRTDEWFSKFKLDTLNGVTSNWPSLKGKLASATDDIAKKLRALMDQVIKQTYGELDALDHIWASFHHRMHTINSCFLYTMDSHLSTDMQQHRASIPIISANISPPTHRRLLECSLQLTLIRGFMLGHYGLQSNPGTAWNPEQSFDRLQQHLATYGPCLLSTTINPSGIKKTKTVTIDGQPLVVRFTPKSSVSNEGVPGSPSPHADNIMLCHSILLVGAVTIGRSE